MSAWDDLSDLSGQSAPEALPEANADLREQRDYMARPGTPSPQEIRATNEPPQRMSAGQFAARSAPPIHIPNLPTPGTTWGSLSNIDPDPRPAAGETYADTADRMAQVQRIQQQQDDRQYRDEMAGFRASGTPVIPGLGPVTDQTGAPLTQKLRGGNIAYDSQGNPVDYSQRDTSGSPILRDPYANVPVTTDPQTGDMYRQHPQLGWRWVGKDDQVAQDAASDRQNKLDTAASSALAGTESQTAKLARDATAKAKLSTKTTAKTLSGLGVPLTDDSGQPIDLTQADPDELKAHIEDTFNQRYATPEANDTHFFGGGYTADALTLRHQLDQDKLKAMQAVDSHFTTLQHASDAQDSLDAIQQQRQQLASGKLDAVNRKRVAAGFDPVQPANALGVAGPSGEAAIPGIDSAAPQQQPTIPGVAKGDPVGPGIQNTLERTALEGAHGFDKAIEGLSRFVGLTGFADFLKNRTEQQEAALRGESGTQLGHQLAAPSATGKVISGVAGGLISQAPGIALGGIPGLIAVGTQAMGNASAQAHDDAKAQGATDDDASKAAGIAALKTLPSTALYASTGGVTSALLKNVLPLAASPLARAAASLVTGTAANIVAGATGKAVTGENPTPTLDDVVNSVVFAAHGASGEHQTGKDLATARSIINGTHPEVAVMDGIAEGKVPQATPEQQASAAQYSNALRAVAAKYIEKAGYQAPEAERPADIQVPAEKQAQAREVTPETSQPVQPAAPEQPAGVSGKTGATIPGLEPDAARTPETSPSKEPVAPISEPASPSIPTDAAPTPVDPAIELSAREKELAAIPDTAPPWKRDLIAGRIRELRAQTAEQPTPTTSTEPAQPAPQPETPPAAEPPTPAIPESTAKEGAVSQPDSAPAVPEVKAESEQPSWSQVEGGGEQATPGLKEPTNPYSAVMAQEHAPSTLPVGDVAETTAYRVGRVLTSKPEHIAEAKTLLYRSADPKSLKALEKLQAITVLPHDAPSTGGPFLFDRDKKHVTAHLGELSHALQLLPKEARQAFVDDSLDHELGHVITYREFTPEEISKVGKELSPKERETLEQTYGSKWKTDEEYGAEAIAVFGQRRRGKEQEAWRLFEEKAKKDKGFADTLRRWLEQAKTIAKELSGKMSARLSEAIKKVQAVLDGLEEKPAEAEVVKSEPDAPPGSDEPFGKLPTGKSTTTLSNNVSEPKQSEPKTRGKSVNEMVKSGLPVSAKAGYGKSDALQKAGYTLNHETDTWEPPEKPLTTPVQTSDVKPAAEKGALSYGAKVRLGKSPQLNTILEELPTAKGDLPDERFFRVKNDRTGETQTVESRDMKPVNERSAEEKKRAKEVSDKLNDVLDQKLRSAKMDPSSFPDVKSKRAALRRSESKLSASSPMAADHDNQSRWMTREAQARGFDSVGELLDKSPDSFTKLAKQWRAFHHRQGGNYVQDGEARAINTKLYGPTNSAGTSQNTLGDAEAFLRGKDGAGEAFEGGSRKAQRDQIVQWAKDRGLLISKAPFRIGGPSDVGQSEHHVFEVGNRWVKLTKGTGEGFGYATKNGAMKSGSALDYITRLNLANEVFGDDVRLHAVWQDKHGNVSLVTSQPDVAGTKLSQPEIQKHMEEAGFQSLGDSRYYRERDNLLVSDLHPENAVEHQGALVPFDAHVSNPSDADKAAVLSQAKQPLTAASPDSPEQSLRNAYEKIVADKARNPWGFPDVHISDVIKEAGLPLDEGKKLIRSLRGKGVQIASGDWSLANDEQKAAGIDSGDSRGGKDLLMHFEPKESTITPNENTRINSASEPPDSGASKGSGENLPASRPETRDADRTTEATRRASDEVEKTQSNRERQLASSSPSGTPEEAPKPAGAPAVRPEGQQGLSAPGETLSEDSGRPEDGKTASERLMRQADEAGISYSTETLKGMIRGDPKVMEMMRAKIREAGKTPLGASNPWRAVVDKAADAAARIKDEASTLPVKDQITAGYDATGTLAHVAGEEAKNHIRLDFNRPAIPNETGAERKARYDRINKDLQAARMIVEAGGDKDQLLEEQQKIAASKDDKLRAKFAPIAQHALDNFDDLNGKIDSHTKLANDTYDRLEASGEDVPKRENYVHRVTLPPDDPDEASPLFPMGGGQGQSPKGMLKSRAFDTIGDAVKAGYDPGTYGLHEADQRMVTNAERIIGGKAFLERLKGIKSPTDGKPIIGQMETVTRPNGTTEQRIPKGYTVVPIMGRPVVVHNFFASTLGSLYGKSALRENAIGRALLSFAAWGKTYTLLGDTFHVGRMLYKGISSGAGADIGRGAALISYDEADLAKAVKDGEISQQTADFVRKEKPLFEEGLKHGLNVGRIADNLVQQAKTHVPGFNTLNTWIFEKLSRSVMAQGFLVFAKRNIASGSFNTRDEAIRQAAKEANEVFGNIQNQGIFQNKTFQDISRLLLLAPNWTETQFRQEARAYAQTGKSAYRFAKSGGKERFLGNAARTMAVGAVALLAINQLVNYLTRGKSTFENPEDGHKLDSWIPGGKRGFFFNPLEIAAEYAHAAFKYAAQKENPVDIAGHIASNKLSPLARGAKEALTGRDYSGRHFLSNADRARAAISDALPSPLPFGAVLEKDPRQPLGYRLNRQPGALEKQLLQSTGMKVTAAQSPRTQMFAIAQPYRADRGQTDSAGEYTELRRALDNDNANASRSEIQWLLQRGKSMENIQHAVGLQKNGTVHPELFAGSVDREADMLQHITPEQKRVYQQAQRDHLANAIKFQQYSKGIAPLPIRDKVQDTRTQGAWQRMRAA